MENNENSTVDKIIVILADFKMSKIKLNTALLKIHEIVPFLTKEEIHFLKIVITNA